MSNQAQNPNNKKEEDEKNDKEENEEKKDNNESKDSKNYDLEEKTAKFGEDIIEFCKSLPKNEINNPLIRQLIRAGTSIGSNYMEADACDSKKDFKYKIGLCKKESKELMHWLRMISKANQDRKEECRNFWQEAHEFVLIFSSIINKAK